MVMTTLEARKILSVIERLVTVLEQRRSSLDREQICLLQRLHDRRRTLRDLVTAREAERAKKIIDFALWRDNPIPLAQLPLGASAV
jgi:hypothetical protein